MNRIRLWLLLSLLFIPLLSFSNSVTFADGSKVHDMNSDKFPVEVTNQLMIYEDSWGALEIEDIVKPTYETAFYPYSSSNQKGRLSKSTYWVKFWLSNSDDKVKRLILELKKPHLDYVSFYQIGAGNLLEGEIQTGRALPFHERKILHRNFIFPITIQSQTTQVIVLKVQTSSYLQLPMTLWDTGSFTAKEQQTNLLLGIYYGCMLVLIAFNLLLFLAVNDKSYLYFILFLSSFTILQLVWDGLAYQYLWPNSPVWESLSNPELLILTSLLGLQFTASFLSISQYSIVYKKVVDMFSLLLLVLLPIIIMAPVVQTTQIAVYFVSASILLCVGCILFARSKNIYTLYYCTGWSLLLFGCVFNLLAAYNILPLNDITLYAPRFGMAANGLVLAIALAKQYNRMKKEKLNEEKQGQLLKSLHTAAAKLTSTYDCDEILRHTLNYLLLVTKSESGCIFTVEESCCEVKAKQGDNVLFDIQNFDNELNIDITSGYHMCRIDKQLVSRTAGQDYQSGWKLPIHYKNQLIGMAFIFSKQRKNLTHSECSILATFAGQVGIAIENARLFHQTKLLASTDSMTGVLNRGNFMQLADSYFNDSSLDHSLSLIMVDIDHFKKINDKYGHLSGDAVIQAMVHVLKQYVQSKGTIGRYGGEEFLILLPGYSMNEAFLLAENIRTSIDLNPVLVDNNTEIRYSISIGISSLNSTTVNVTQLIKEADAALYMAKEGGRNRTIPFVSA